MLIVLRLFGYVWALPPTLIGLALWVAAGGGFVRWSAGCIEMVPKKIFGKGEIAGQTWGFVILYRSQALWNRSSLRVHERRHVLQYFILGLLFLPAYGLHFAWLRYVRKLPYQEAYRAIWAERAAYALERRYIASPSLKFWGALYAAD